MSDAHSKQHEYRELQRQARVNEMRLKIARQNAALGSLRRDGYRDMLEGFYDPSNIFDPRDYLFETPRFGGAIPTTLNDRDDGRNFPLFRTEQELAVIRGAARLISASNPIAVGVLASLTNYVIGNGFHYAAAAKRPNQQDVVATAGAVIDEFLTDNDWCGDLDRELFQRSRVDGEYFLGLWHVGGGHVQARAIEPDQVTEPGNKAGLEEWLGSAESAASSWTFGIHSDAMDAQEIHGFYVQWTNRDLDWDYLPGGTAPIIPPHGAGTWLEHAKLNVVRSVKRGLSDFFSIQGNLDLARRVLRNMGEGSAVQAAIAWIQEVAPGTTQAQVNTGTLSRADASYTTATSQGASRVHLLQQYDPGTILKVPSGQKYLPGPLGAQHAPNFITAAESLLRTVALRWNLPEHLVTGSAANNDFASSLVAETPFVKYAESQQQFYVRRDRRTLWRVLWFAWTAGRFGDAPWRIVQQAVEITVTPPQIEVRDPEKETRVRQMLNAAGILSRHTWAAQESLDYDQEQKNLKAEAASQSSVTSGSATAASNHVGQMDEALEEWDPAKHPRGGFSQNLGWFSTASGSSPSAPAHSGTTTSYEPDTHARAIAQRPDSSEREGTSISSPQDSSSPGPFEVCFAAGTLVSTEEGWMPIERIGAGKLVHCAPQEDPSAPVELRHIVAVYHNGPQPIVIVSAGPLQIRTTAKHPLWTQRRGWVPAEKLAAGDVLLGRQGDALAVTDVTASGTVEPVYNLRVAEYGTYFVGSPENDASALVHNASAPAASAKDLTAGVTAGPIEVKANVGKRRYRTSVNGPEVANDALVIEVSGKGVNPNDVEIIQFIGRTIDGTKSNEVSYYEKKYIDPQTGETSDTRRYQPGTAKYPAFQLDNVGPHTFTATRGHSTVNRENGKLEFFDSPSFVPESNPQTAIVESYILYKGKVMYKIHWEKTNKPENEFPKDNRWGREIDAMPNWAIRKLHEEAGNKYAPSQEAGVFTPDPTRKEGALKWLKNHPMDYQPGP